MSSLSTWLMGTFLRWLPHRAPTGLVAIGNPDENTPVLVTGNYSLTVARVKRALRGLDLWLLVAPSDGINVWCAACGGHFTEHQVVSAVKTAGLADKVAHHTLVLPALSAPGIDRGRLKELTGFEASFGPVYARDIPAYLAAGQRKTPGMRRADFGLSHRLDKLVGMNFTMWAPLAALFALAWPRSLVHVSVLFWALAAASYILFPWLPGRAGWRKSLTPMAGIAVIYCLAGWLGSRDPLAYWPWVLGGAGMTFAIFFDIAGSIGPLPSDAEALIQRVRIRRLAFLFRNRPVGRLTFERERCVGCRTCCEICPIGVYDFDGASAKALLARPGECFGCRACVKQCPAAALSFAPEESGHPPPT